MSTRSTIFAVEQRDKKLKWSPDHQVTTAGWSPWARWATCSTRKEAREIMGYYMNGHADTRQVRLLVYRLAR